MVRPNNWTHTQGSPTRPNRGCWNPLSGLCNPGFPSPAQPRAPEFAQRARKLQPGAAESAAETVDDQTQSFGEDIAGDADDVPYQTEEVAGTIPMLLDQLGTGALDE